MATVREKEVLRGLAGRVREIAELPEQKARRQRWYNHNDLKGERPLVLCFPEGAWRELVTEADLICEDNLLRQWECGQ